MADCKSCINRDVNEEWCDGVNYTLFFCAAWDEFGTLELMSHLDCPYFVKRDDRTMEERLRELTEADAGGFRART